MTYCWTVAVLSGLSALTRIAVADYPPEKKTGWGTAACVALNVAVAVWGLCILVWEIP